jgi:dihydroneopterin aldolase
VDYGAVAAAVAAVVTGPHADLLEHLAERIARAALSASGCGSAGSASASAVTISVRKLRPPLPLDVVSTGVTIHRRRDEVQPAR